MADAKVQRLIEYVKGVRDGGDGARLYAAYRDDIQRVTPQEAFEVFHALLGAGSEPRDILAFLNKIINAFYGGLSNYRWSFPDHDGFLKELSAENRAMEQTIADLKPFLKEAKLPRNRRSLLAVVDRLAGVDAHYSKKENILFPYLEQHAPRFEGVSIMWAAHDQARKRLKDLRTMIENPDSSAAAVQAAAAHAFFSVLYLVKKEELILFPAAAEVLPEEEWAAMDAQRWEFSAPMLHERPAPQVSEPPETAASESTGAVYHTATGQLRFDELEAIFASLPVDITFVGADNKVRFFSKPRQRIFPRSPAIIGRDVKHCHPPDSVHVVEEIIEAFRSGQRSTATFWLQFEGRFIVIQYFALRDGRGTYQGVLEVSQDAGNIRSLKGERRILQWDSKTD